MGNLHLELAELAQHLRQERLFIEAERQQIQMLNEKILQASQDVFHAAWIRDEQLSTYDMIYRPHSSPAICCQRSNLLRHLKFIDGHKVLGSYEAVYGEILCRLRENPQLCAHCLIASEAQSAEMMKEVANIMFSSIFASGLFPEDDERILYLLRYIIELQVAPSENPRRLLRHSSCAFSRIYRAYTDTLPQARIFLSSALHQPILQLLMEDELYLDIDPSKARIRFPPEERHKRFGPEGSEQCQEALARYRAWTISKLVKITKRFIKGIQLSMHSFPVALSWLVRTMYEVLLTSKQVEDTQEINAICVDLVFAYFICPAIVAPEVHGICDAPVSHIARFNLMQVAQIIQVLAMSSWELPDPKLGDLYSHFNKEDIVSLVPNLLEQRESQVPPRRSSPLMGMSRASCLIPLHSLSNLFTFLQNVLQEFPEGALVRRQLEELLVHIPPSMSTCPSGSPQSAALKTNPQHTGHESPRMNLIGRVKGVKSKHHHHHHQKPSQEPAAHAEETGEASDGHSSHEEEPLDYDTVLVITFSSLYSTLVPGMMHEEKVLASVQSSKPSRVRVNLEDSVTMIEKRTRFSLSHDGSMCNTSDNLEAVSEAASNHSMASSLDDVEPEDQPDNLSDMVSANVSGRGTPNVSGRDTPSSQVTEGDADSSGLAVPPENPDEPHQNIPVTVAKSSGADIDEKFGKFEIKALIGSGDEAVSHVSDTWSTDVLASDSETIEAVDGRHEQMREQLLDRHLAELDSMQGGNRCLLAGDLPGEMMDTASEAWSTDVMASDSERMTEFDTDDAQSITRSDGTGRSEMEIEMTVSDSGLGPSDVSIHQKFPLESAKYSSPADVNVPFSSGMDYIQQGESYSFESCKFGDSKVRPAQVLNESESPSKSSKDGGEKRFKQYHNEPELQDKDIVNKASSSINSDLQVASQSLGRLSLNLSSLPYNGVLNCEKPLLMNSFITPPSGQSAPLIDFEGPSPEVQSGPSKTLSKAPTEKSDSLHLSTVSLASSSSSGSDVAHLGCSKGRSGSNASSELIQDISEASSDSILTMPCPGSIPKSISFDKTAEKGDREPSFDFESRNRKSFLKGLIKLPGFKGKRKMPHSLRSVEDAYFSRVNEPGVRRAVSEDGRPPTIIESSDDILAKYRNKKSCQEDDVIQANCQDEMDRKASSSQLCEEDARLSINVNDLESSYAFMDAKRKLRLVLSVADSYLLPCLAEGYSSCSIATSGDYDTVTWLRCQLAEARTLQERSLQAQIHETIRCVQLFDSKGQELLVRSLKADLSTRSPYVAYLVRSKQGLLVTLAHLERLNSCLKNEQTIIMASILEVCIRMFLEQREKRLAAFRKTFTHLTVPDENVQCVDNLLAQLYEELRRDPMCTHSSQEQLDAAHLALEQSIMSTIYIHAIYPHGDGDVSRDQVLHEHMAKLASVITPSHKDLCIPKIYHYECPWPSAQAEISYLCVYKTAGDKLRCVVRTSEIIMNLLSLAHERNVPAADDFIPVLVYVLIKANPPGLLSTVQYVNLFYEKRLEGEQQYWWAQFCSAIEFIKTMEQPS